MSFMVIYQENIKKILLVHFAFFELHPLTPQLQQEVTAVSACLDGAPQISFEPGEGTKISWTERRESRDLK